MPTTTQVTAAELADELGLPATAMADLLLWYLDAHPADLVYDRSMQRGGMFLLAPAAADAIRARIDAAGLRGEEATV